MDRKWWLLTGSTLLVAACTLGRSGTNEQATSSNTTSTATTSSTTTTSSTNSGGGGSGPENCLNGIDDNGDSLVDCADPQCSPTDFDCVPDLGAVPYVTASPGTCATGLTERAYFDCSGCACDATDGDCGLQVQFFASSACVVDGTESALRPILDTGACEDVIDYNNNAAVFYEATPSTNPALGATAPSCAPAQGTVPATPQTYCQTSNKGLGCAANEVCVPASANPWCVEVPGPGCPAAYPNANQVVAQGIAPSCTCTCTQGTPGCASSALLIAGGNNSCGGGGATTAFQAGACTDSTVNSIHSIAFNAPILQTATCDLSATPSGGTPKTVCCR